MNLHKKTVVVGMSGGVDSSVAAYLLKEQGYEVKGLFMQNWQSEPGEVCSSEVDFKDASEVCDILDISLHRANFSDDYWDRVFKEFLSEHEQGRTPNPDILCNREIKFKSFLDYAFNIGADFIATGHYAKTQIINGRTYLSRARDIKKDQTYFLHEVNEKEFAKCLFPLANLLKPEVREIAKDQNLITADKKDSVGICFVGERNLKDFLGRFILFSKGLIKDENGHVIGEHQGSILYTEGQRQGLMIGGVKGRDELPWYVFKKDILNNEIYVCQGVNNPLLMNKGLNLNTINWINNIIYEYPLDCLIQVRHQHTPIKCIIDKINDGFEVNFVDEIRAIAPGQSAVFYKDDICMGGGIITKTF
jgi:tRNA-specific 2-thiouridylase|tara:strand:- start:2076 stop:3161 length:1086 start_codon:yes stop_codon:yes gene_type:complete